MDRRNGDQSDEGGTSTSPALDIGYLEPEDTMYLAREKQFAARRRGGQAPSTCTSDRPSEPVMAASLTDMVGAAIEGDSFEWHCAFQKYHSSQLQEEKFMKLAVREFGDQYRAKLNAKKLVKEVAANDSEWRARQSIAPLPQRKALEQPSKSTNVARYLLPNASTIRREAANKFELKRPQPISNSSSSVNNKLLPRVSSLSNAHQMADPFDCSPQLKRAPSNANRPSPSLLSLGSNPSMSLPPLRNEPNRSSAPAHERSMTFGCGDVEGSSRGEWKKGRSSIDGRGGDVDLKSPRVVKMRPIANSSTGESLSHR